MGQKSHVQRLVDADCGHKFDVAQRLATGHAIDQLGHYDGCVEKHGRLLQACELLCVVKTRRQRNII